MTHHPTRPLTLNPARAHRPGTLLRTGGATLLAAGAITAWGLLNPSQAQTPPGKMPTAATASATAASAAPDLRGMHGHGPRHPEGRGMGVEGDMHGPEGMGMMGGHHLERLLDDLNVTPAQRAQIKPLNDKARDEVRALHDQGRTLHRQYLDLLASPKLDTAAIAQAHQKIQALHQQMGDRMASHLLAIAQVLTPEQRAALAERMKRGGGHEAHTPRR